MPGCLMFPALHYVLTTLRDTFSKMLHISALQHVLITSEKRHDKCLMFPALQYVLTTLEATFVKMLHFSALHSRKVLITLKERQTQGTHTRTA